MTHDKFIESEMEVLTYLEKIFQLGTQKVIRNKSGEPVTVLSDGSMVTSLEWVKGKTLENVEITNELAFMIGMMIGSVHTSMRKVKIENRYIYGSEMDLASIFSHINNDKLNEEILHGYESYCSIKVDEKAIQACLSLQVLLFIICQHEKIYSQPWIEKSMGRWCNEIFLQYLQG